MSRINYLQRIRSTGMTRLTSLHCRLCYHSGKSTKAFIGVYPEGRVTWGSKPADQQFRKEIWQALKDHLKKEHNWTLQSNGNGSWMAVPPWERTS